MQAKLTKRALDALRAPAEGRAYVYDTELPGFGVVVASSGGISFFVQYRVPGAGRAGAAKRMRLGQYPAITVDIARAEAKKLLGKVAHGADPAAARAERKHACRVRDLGKDWLADGEGRWKAKTLEEHRRVWEKRILPALGSRAVADVTTAHCAALHRALKGTPYSANRLRDALINFFAFAESQGLRPKHSNPARDVRKYKEHARERFLTPEEAVRLGDALARAEREGLPPAPTRRKAWKLGKSSKHTTKAKKAGQYDRANPFAVAAIRFLLLTGWRKNEALTLEWSMISTERGTATLPDTKTGKSTRHLGATALALLEALPRLKGSPYCFPGKDPKQPLVEINRVWYAVRYAAGLEEVRLHDLRHSFASMIASDGGSLLLIGKLLGHKSLRSTERYSHLLDDPVKATADVAAGKIASLLDGSAPTTKVLPFKSA
jgi:integrase